MPAELHTPLYRLIDIQIPLINTHPTRDHPGIEPGVHEQHNLLLHLVASHTVAQALVHVPHGLLLEVQELVLPVTLLALQVVQFLFVFDLEGVQFGVPDEDDGVGVVPLELLDL